MLLGKAHKLLEKGLYSEALARALKAKNLKLTEQFQWLCYSIEGKARYHLGDKENALPALKQALQILESRPDNEKALRSLQNIISEITGYIEKIESPGD
jgi:tetratricopeptide (TPR) repeat protein